MALTRRSSVLAPIILLLSLATISECTRIKSNSGFTLKVIPRDHPTSPLYVANLSQVERNRRLAKFSEARASYLLSSITGNATHNLKEVGFHLLLSYFYYVVEIEMGDPLKSLYLLLDIETSLMWTQCKDPLSNYYEMNDIYDSSKSYSYRRIPTYHPTCSLRGSYFENNKGLCTYHSKYGNSKTSGVGSFERVRVSREILLKNVIFGCSTTYPIKLLQENKISGILGLSNSPVSIMSQFWEVVKGRYSYCLIPFYNAQQAPFYLTFGDNIPSITERPLHVVKFARSPKTPDRYYLNLLDISVGETRMEFSMDTFKIRDDGTGGLLIDSSTPVPSIDATTPGRNAYDQVLSRFQSFYDLHGLVRTYPTQEKNYQLCYNNKENFHDYASMTYHFKEGHEYVVKKQFTNIFNEDDHYFCVSLAKGNGYSTLGAWHQQNMRLIFNTDSNELQYGFEACSG